jgi:hypothetical protein
MANAKPGEKLAKELVKNFAARVSDEEMQNMEQLLGPESIRFKLNPAGTKQLFRALGAVAQSNDPQVDG